MSSKKIKFDFKSIRFKLWAYFVGFAVLLIAIIWCLQVFFLNTYYEAMKIKETSRIANKILNDYQNSGYNLEDLGAILNDISISNDIYLRIENGSGTILFTPDISGPGHLNVYSFQVQALRTKLESGRLDRAAIITPGGNNTRTLSYACYLNKVVGSDGNTINHDRSYILYIFTPLYPVESTVSILRAQLVYITFISIVVAFAMAIYLSNRITRPIKNITNSAAEMGKGNYGITFHGGHYTEIGELADTLTAASRELEKTDMYQKDLIANVSHDLRTPLTMIKSYAEMVRDLSGDNPEKRKTHLNVIIEETDRLNTLVSDMLNMSRMQSRSIVLEKTDFDIRRTVESLLTSYDILADQEGYKFIFKCSTPLIINGDEAKIKQVISNLINNAVKYCGSDKEIIVSLKRSGRKMRCEVTDHGAGIAPDEITHVWERYYKSSTHHVRPTDGSGLGLSIVKEILSMHRANYGVNSKIDKGSTFWFEMNIVKAKNSK